MEASGQLQHHSRFNQFLTFGAKQKLLLLSGIEGQKYKFIPMLFRIHTLIPIYCTLAFGRLDKIENIVLPNIFYKIFKCFRSSEVLK